MNRVNVNITARDLTRGELGRMRRNFSALGQDIDRAVGRRTRENFSRLSQSVNQSRRDLTSMRGAIPDDEFFRLDRALRQSQRTLQRGFSNVGDRAFARVIARLREVDEGFRDLNDNAQIRVRVDNSALRRADARLAQFQRQQQARLRAGQNAILRADRRLSAGLGERNRAVRVRVDPDTRNFGPRLRAGILRWTGLRQTGHTIGGILSDGIGQGIISGFKGAGPIGVTILAGIIAASVSVIGAALAGLLTTALGLAFISIAAISAAQSDEVKEQWAKTLESLKKNFEDVGKPLIPVLESALLKVEDMADRAAPQFKKAMEDAAPAIDTFIDKLLEGFERFGEAAFKPVMDAFEVFGPVFGEVFSDFMNDLGENFGDLARLVRDHSAEIEQALRIVFGVLSGLIEVVEFLASAWIAMFRGANDAIAILINYGLIPLATAALNSFEIILDSAAQAFAWVPGVGDSLKTAQDAFSGFKEDTLDKLRVIGDAADGANDRLDRLNTKRKLEADISSWTSRLETASEKLKRTTNQKARVNLTADIGDLSRKLGLAYMKLQAINGKTATTYVKTVYTSTSVGGHPTQRKATGGNIGSAATGGARSNMTLVGEQGPEMVDLAPGSRVRSNPDTRRLLGGQGGADGSATFVFKSSGRRVDDFLLEILREAIHQRGGDPVKVLGG